jgi:hypothetical protein
MTLKMPEISYLIASRRIIYSDIWHEFHDITKMRYRSPPRNSNSFPDATGVIRSGATCNDILRDCFGDDIDFRVFPYRARWLC